MKKLSVALWKTVTRYWEENGQTFSEDSKQLIGWFASHADAKRYIRNACVAWSSREMRTYEEYDCFGWFPGQVVPQNSGMESKWKVSSFLFPQTNRDVEYNILRPLD